MLSYHDLLNVFFAIHDPTTLNRQGSGRGHAVPLGDLLSRRAAKEDCRGRSSGRSLTLKIWDNPIVTEVTPFDKFYMAEDYHQEYFAHNSFQPYCRVVIAPKVTKFRKQFVDRLKK